MRCIHTEITYFCWEHDEAQLHFKSKCIPITSNIWSNTYITTILIAVCWVVESSNVCFTGACTLGCLTQGVLPTIFHYLSFLSTVSYQRVELNGDYLLCAKQTRSKFMYALLCSTNFTIFVLTVSNGFVRDWLRGSICSQWICDL